MKSPYIAQTRINCEIRENHPRELEGWMAFLVKTFDHHPFIHLHLLFWPIIADIIFLHYSGTFNYQLSFFSFILCER